MISGISLRNSRETGKDRLSHYMSLNARLLQNVAKDGIFLRDNGVKMVSCKIEMVYNNKNREKTSDTKKCNASQDNTVRHYCEYRHPSKD